VYYNLEVMKNKIVIALGLLVSIIAVLYLVTAAGLLFYMSPVSTFFSLSSAKQVSGVVVDCETAEPISGVSVAMYGLGWGWSKNGGLIWDKEYSASDVSTTTGSFQVNYKIGTALVARKDGYLTARAFVDNGSTLEVKLRKIGPGLDSSESTYNCRLESECYKSRTENGVEIGWNDCTSPQLR
jgi:hypothetical protein